MISGHLLEGPGRGNLQFDCQAKLMSVRSLDTPPTQNSGSSLLPAPDQALSQTRFQNLVQCSQSPFPDRGAGKNPPSNTPRHTASTRCHNAPLLFKRRPHGRRRLDVAEIGAISAASARQVVQSAASPGLSRRPGPLGLFGSVLGFGRTRSPTMDFNE